MRSAKVGAAIAPGPGASLVLVDPQKDTVLAELRQAAAALKLKADQLVITKKTRDEAGGFLVQINQLKRRGEDRRKQIVERPTKYAAGINAAVRDLLAPVVEADRILRDKIRDFIRHEEQEQAEANAEARRAQLRSEALAVVAGKAEAAGEAGADQLLEEAVQAEGEARQLQTFAAAGGPVERSLRPSTGGLVGTKKVWTYAVLDLGKVPDDYLKPRELDTVKVRTAIAAGIRDVDDETPGIPGLRIFEDDQVQVRTS